MNTPTNPRLPYLTETSGEIDTQVLQLNPNESIEPIEPEEIDVERFLVDASDQIKSDIQVATITFDYADTSERDNSRLRGQPFCLPYELFINLPKEIAEAIAENRKYVETRLKNIPTNAPINEREVIQAYSLAVSLKQVAKEFPHLSNYIDGFLDYVINPDMIVYPSSAGLENMFNSIAKKISLVPPTPSVFDGFETRDDRKLIQEFTAKPAITQQKLTPTKPEKPKSSWFSNFKLPSVVTKAVTAVAAAGAMFLGFGDKKVNQEVIQPVSIESTNSEPQIEQFGSEVMLMVEPNQTAQQIPNEPMPLPMINDPKADIQNQQNLIHDPAAQIENQEAEADDYQQLVDSLDPIETPIELNLRGVGNFPGQNPAFVVRTFIRNNQEVSAYLPSESIDFRGQTFEITTFGGNLKRRNESLEETNRSYRDGRRLISTGDFRYMLDAKGNLVTYIETVQEIGGETSWLALTHLSHIPNSAVQLPATTPTRLQQQIRYETVELLDSEDDWIVVDFDEEDEKDLNQSVAEIDDNDFEEITLDDLEDDDSTLIELTEADFVLEDDEFPYDSNFRVV